MSTTAVPTGEIELLSSSTGGLDFRYSPAELRRRMEHLDELRRAILIDGTDYSIIPGTQKPTLLKPGAEKLLMAAGLGFTIERIPEVGVDPRQGVTYRTSIKRGDEITAQCDGYAGYDEDRFYQESGKRRAEAERRERANAAKYQRQVNPRKWEDLDEDDYKAPWNSVMKMAEKRSLVGAVLNALAASGLFSQDLEDMAPVATVPEAFDALAHLTPFLALLDKDKVKRLSAWRTNNEMPGPRQMTQAQVEQTLVQIGVLLGERPHTSPDIDDSDKAGNNIPPDVTLPVATEDDGRPFDDDAPSTIDRVVAIKEEIAQRTAAVDAATGEISPDDLAKRRGWDSAKDEADVRTAAHDILMSRVADGRIDKEAAKATWAAYGEHPTAEQHDTWLARFLPAVAPVADPAGDRALAAFDQAIGYIPPAQTVITADEAKRLHRDMGVAKLKMDEHQALITMASDGRTGHAGELAPDELALAKQLLAQVKDGTLSVTALKGAAEEMSGGPNA